MRARKLRTLVSALVFAPAIHCSGQTPGRIYVDGSRYPLTQAGIQQAFTDACRIGNGSGTEVFLPTATTVTVSNTSVAQFTITCPLRIHGPQMGSFWFIIGNTVPNTVPLFLVKPSGANLGWNEFDHFRVTSPGHFGGTVIFLDSTNGTVNQLRIHDIQAVGTDPAAWFLDMNTAGGGDRYFLGHIWDNDIEAGGIHMNSTGTADSWLVEHNTFGPNSGSTHACIDATTEQGSAHITAFNNNGGCDGGFFISHGTTQPKILYNQIEQPATSTEPNSAIIDLVGDTYAIDGAEIRGNNINAHNFVTTNIRVGNATNTQIGFNVLSIKPGSGVGIALTGNSSATIIDPTIEFIGAGGGAVAMTNATAANPFTQLFPTSTGTLPATIKNDAAGGLLICTSSNNCFQFIGSGSQLYTPNGGNVVLKGATDGAAILKTQSHAGTATPISLLPIGSGTVAKLQLDQDFTTANNTNLQTITGSTRGLTWSVPANPLNWSFHCSLSYSQATGNATVAFGIQAATNAPTSILATGTQQITIGPPSTYVSNTLPSLSTTTATNIVSGTPGATGSLYTVMLDGTIELPGSPNTINIMVSTANGLDPVTVKRGSECSVY